MKSFRKSSHTLNASFGARNALQRQSIAVGAGPGFEMNTNFAQAIKTTRTRRRCSSFVLLFRAISARYQQRTMSSSHGAEGWNVREQMSKERGLHRIFSGIKKSFAGILFFRYTNLVDTFMHLCTIRVLSLLPGYVRQRVHQQ